MPQILSRARDAGAQHAAYILLRLNDNVEQVFIERMTHHFPDRIKKILAHLKEVREGQVGDRTFFKRHVGEGKTWNVIEQLFETSSRKNGFQDTPDTPIPATFRRPGPTQLSLWQF